MKVIGIDLGTANTIIYVKGVGIALREPSVVAVDAKTKRVMSVGNEAKMMLGKTPGSIIAMRPLKDGVIAEFDITAKMLNHYFKKVAGSTIFSRPRVVVCIPYGVTEVEKRAVEEVTLEAGAQSVALVEEPVAAAFGSGLRVDDIHGSMIVDIGGGTTEVAVLSMGGIVLSNSLRIAGDELDYAIRDYIKRVYGVLIGDTTAETLKKQIGSAHYTIDRGVVDVRGRNVLTGLPAVQPINTLDLLRAMNDELNHIIGNIKQTLEATPPELASDIYETGIMLAGGSALLAGLDRLVYENTQIRTFVAKNPIDSVALGIGKIIENDAHGIINYRAR